MIPTSPEKAMGDAVFLMEMGEQDFTRQATLEDFKLAARKLKGSDAKRFDALMALRDAMQQKDDIAMDRAKDRMEKVYAMAEKEQAPLFNSQKERMEFAEALAPEIGLPPEESLAHWMGMRPGPKAKDDPVRLLCYEVSQRVSRSSELVLWVYRNAVRPAIYCENIETALYVHTFFLAAVEGVGFRICPYDGEVFFQDRPNQNYCTPAHREAHRVARFRKKKKESPSGKGSGKRGTVISLSTGNDSGSRLKQRIGERRKPKKRN